jgi:hypothetical protein
LEEGSVALVDRAQAILLRPRETWPVIDAEQTTTSSLYTSYIMPLAAIGPIANVIGTLVFGPPSFGGFTAPRQSVGGAIVAGVISWLVGLAFVYVLAIIIDMLAPNFGGTSDRLKALKVAAYSGTASSIAQVFQIIPALSILGILGLYSLYLAYLGLPVLMKTPADRALTYTIACIVAAIVVFIILGIVVGIVVGIFAGVASL